MKLKTVALTAFCIIVLLFIAAASYRLWVTSDTAVNRKNKAECIAAVEELSAEDTVLPSRRLVFTDYIPAGKVRTNYNGQPVYPAQLKFYLETEDNIDEINSDGIDPEFIPTVACDTPIYWIRNEVGYPIDE